MRRDIHITKDIVEQEIELQIGIWTMLQNLWKLNRQLNMELESKREKDNQQDEKGSKENRETAELTKQVNEISEKIRARQPDDKKRKADTPKKSPPKNKEKKERSPQPLKRIKQTAQTYPPNQDIPIQMETEFKCALCEFTSKTKANVNAHRKRKHPTEKELIGKPPPQPDDERALLFTCPVCLNWQTTKQGFLLAHIKKHEKEKKFRCEGCTFSTRTEADLNQHTQLNNCKRPVIKCPLCEWCNPYMTNLKRHMKQTHPNTRTCRVEGCQWETMDKKSFEEHQIQHQQKSRKKPAGESQEGSKKQKTKNNGEKRRRRGPDREEEDKETSKRLKQVHEEETELAENEDKTQRDNVANRRKKK
jgi:hypothetical protein